MSSPFPARKTGAHHRPRQGMGFRRTLGQLSTQAASLVQPHPENLPDAVHGTRLLIKRLRAWIWLAKPALDEKGMRRAKSQLRRAAHLLAEQRDLVVTHALLGRLSSSPTFPGTTDKTSLEALKKSEAILLQVLNELSLQSKNVSSWPETGDRLDKAFRAMQKAGKKALKTEASTAFHNWRKKTKQLGFLLPWLRSSPDKDMARFIKKINVLQHQLGEYHDCVVAQDHLEAQPSAEAKIGAHAVRQTEKFLRKKQSHLRKEAKRLFRHLSQKVWDKATGATILKKKRTGSKNSTAASPRPTPGPHPPASGPCPSRSLC